MPPYTQPSHSAYEGHGYRGYSYQPWKPYDEIPRHKYPNTWALLVRWYHSPLWHRITKWVTRDTKTERTYPIVSIYGDFGGEG